MKRIVASATLLMGTFVAGVLAAGAFIEFDRFDKVTITVTIDEFTLWSGTLAFLLGIMVWAASRWRAGQDVEAGPRRDDAASTGKLPRVEACAEARSGKEEPLGKHLTTAAGSRPGGTDANDADDGSDTIHDEVLQENLSEVLESESDVSIADARRKAIPERSTLSRSASAHSEVKAEANQAAGDLSAFLRLLAKTWHEYLRRGDGHFNAVGLQEQLADMGINAHVREGDAVRAADNVLVVEDTRRETDYFYVVPSFAKSPRAAPDWFEDSSDGALTRRTQKLLRLAEGRWTDTGFVVVRKGVIA